eukprot:2186550-Pleurochrysis_carterae.AAC.1
MGENHGERKRGRIGGQGARERGSEGARGRGSEGARERGSKGARARAKGSEGPSCVGLPADHRGHVVFAREWTPPLVEDLRDMMCGTASEALLTRQLSLQT